MLYTIVPMEMIFPQPIEPPEEKRVGGVLMKFRRDASGIMTKSRIISTDLSLFLMK